MLSFLCSKTSRSIQRKIISLSFAFAGRIYLVYLKCPVEQQEGNVKEPLVKIVNFHASLRKIILYVYYSM